MSTQLTMPLRTQIAQVLNEAASEAERLGAALSAEDAVIERHLTTLQGIDRTAQTLQAVASVLSSENPQDAVHSIPLNELRKSLSAACAT